MALPTQTKSFTTAISAALDADLKGLTDNISIFSPLLAAFFGKIPLAGSTPGKSKVREDIRGGDTIRLNVEYALNGQTKRMVNDMDTIPIAKSEIVTKAVYDWTWYLEPCAIPDGELNKVKGEAALLNLVETYKNNTAKSLAYTIANDLFGDGSTAGSITGLLQAVADDGLVNTGTTYGGITLSTNTWWYNSFKDCGSYYVAANGATTKFVLLNAIDTLLIDCVKGGMGRGPDLGIANENAWTYLMWSLNNRGTPVVADTVDLKAGVRSISYGPMKIMFEPYMPADFSTGAATTSTDGDIIMLNTDFIFPVIDPDVNFKWKGPERSPTQMADVWKLQWRGNLVTKNRRANGLLWDIAAAT